MVVLCFYLCTAMWEVCQQIYKGIVSQQSDWRRWVGEFTQAGSHVCCQSNQAANDASLEPQWLPTPWTYKPYLLSEQVRICIRFDVGVDISGRFRVVWHGCQKLQHLPNQAARALPYRIQLAHQRWYCCARHGAIGRVGRRVCALATWPACEALEHLPCGTSAKEDQRMQCCVTRWAHATCRHQRLVECDNRLQKRVCVEAECAQPLCSGNKCELSCSRLHCMYSTPSV